tara:strand:+ start:388 stop:543 length:156 start_codon:yes stop_codon:yes gene_type:complete
MLVAKFYCFVLITDVVKKDFAMFVACGFVASGNADVKKRNQKKANATQTYD